VNVLVIEHDPVARKNLLEELARLSFVGEINCAATESCADEMLSTLAPDVVFLDMQLPDSGGFRLAGRLWKFPIPVIVCTTGFERRLLEALSRHRAEYLVRPFGTQELGYVLTRARRPDPINPAENLKHILDAGGALGFEMQSRLIVSRNGMPMVLETADIAAVRYDRGRIYLWTRDGIFETTRPAGEIWNHAGFSGFQRVYRNGLLSADEKRFGKDLNRARRWLRPSALADFLLNRPSLPSMAGTPRVEDLSQRQG
jgi:DNA-binding LytR/AlgR family response regulator